MPADPYIGEISLMSFSAIPRGWVPCQGQILPIAQNQALFSLLGTTYGGDGRSTFALPDLTGRVPIGMGGGYALGVKDGHSTQTLTVDQIPRHIHMAATDATTTTGLVNSPASTTALGQSSGAQVPSGTAVEVKIYSKDAGTGTLAPAAVGVSGNGQPHNNMMPYLPIGFCIAIYGTFPSRN